MEHINVSFNAINKIFSYFTLHESRYNEGKRLFRIEM